MIFVYKLDFFSTLRIIPYLLSPNFHRVMFFFSDFIGVFFSRCIKFFAPSLIFQRVDLDYSQQLIEGGCLWDWVEVNLELISKEVFEKLKKRHTYVFSIPEKIQSDRLNFFLRKKIELSLYEIVTLITWTKEYLSNYSAIEKVVFFTNHSDLIPVLREGCEKIISQAEIVGYINIRESIPIRFAYFLFRQLSTFFLALIEIVRNGNSDLANEGFSVAIQSVWGSERKNRLSDFWWFEKSNIAYSDLVYFYNHKSQIANREKFSKYSKLGLRQIILEKSNRGDSGIYVNRYAKQHLSWVLIDIFNFFKTYYQLRNSLGKKWQISQWLGLIVRFRGWQAFLEAENIKVIFDVGETNQDFVSLAADATGAIKVGTHWSSEFSHIRTRIIPMHHVYFVWGPHHHAILRRDFSVSNYVQIGNIFNRDNQTQETNGAFKKLEIDLMRPDAKFTIGLLDRSLGPTARIPQTYHFSFYDSFITLAEEHIELHLLIKPKSSSFPKIFEAYPELWKRVEKLVNDGRVELIDGEIPPTFLSRRSQLVVGLGINSGAILCAHRGSRTVLWDPSKTLEGPLSSQLGNLKNSSKHIIFHDLDLLIKSINSFRLAPNKYLDFGLFSDEQILSNDPFGDQLAGIRAGDFISKFLENLKSESSREKALKATFAYYSAKWGKDKINTSQIT